MAYPLLLPPFVPGTRFSFTRRTTPKLPLPRTFTTSYFFSHGVVAPLGAARARRLSVLMTRSSRRYSVSRRKKSLRIWSFSAALSLLSWYRRASRYWSRRDRGDGWLSSSLKEVSRQIFAAAAFSTVTTVGLAASRAVSSMGVRMASRLDWAAGAPAPRFPEPAGFLSTMTESLDDEYLDSTLVFPVESLPGDDWPRWVGDGGPREGDDGGEDGGVVGREDEGASCGRKGRLLHDALCTTVASSGKRSSVELIFLTAFPTTMTDLSLELCGGVVRGLKP